MARPPSKPEVKRALKVQVALNEMEWNRLDEEARKISSPGRRVAMAEMARRLIRKGLGLKAEG